MKIEGTGSGCVRCRWSAKEGAFSIIALWLDTYPDSTLGKDERLDIFDGDTHIGARCDYEFALVDGDGIESQWKASFRLFHGDEGPLDAIVVEVDGAAPVEFEVEITPGRRAKARVRRSFVVE